MEAQTPINDSVPFLSFNILNSKISLFGDGYINSKGDLVPSTKPVEEISFSTYFDFIKNGKWKDKITNVRNGEIEKGFLPGVTGSGTFSYRNTKSLIKHSGVIVIDIDLKDNPDIDFTVLKNRLRKDVFIYALHHSASGKGLACYVTIDPKKHLESFLQLEHYFKHTYNVKIDKACKNVDRYRYVSEDPDLYKNDTATIFSVFSAVAPAIESTKSKNKSKSQLPAFTKLIDGLEEEGIDITAIESDWFKIACAIGRAYDQDGEELFQRVSQFHPDHTPSRTAEKYSEALRNNKNNAGRVDVATLEWVINMARTTYGFSINPQASTKAQSTTVPREAIPNAFWYIVKDDKGKSKLMIDPYKLVSFMAIHGFYKYYPPGNIDPILIRIISSIAEEINTNTIKDFVSDYIESLPYQIEEDFTRIELYNLAFHSTGAYFTEPKLEWLKVNDRDFLKDTSDTAYIFFKTEIVKVTAGQYSIEKYSALKYKVVWKNQVKDFVFSPTDFTESDFYNFIQLVSGRETTLSENIKQDRLDTATKILGYLLHRFKNPSKPYAIIACEDTETVQLGGGTGKSLIGLALAAMLPTTFIEGKGFDATKNFAWQSYKLGDAIIWVDDLDKKFSIEQINSQITAGFTLERKNRPSVSIPFEDSPKFFLTTNYVVDESSNASKRRIRKIILTPYFGPKKEPVDVFGKMFFIEWDDLEWRKFYSFMIHCISAYLTDPTINAAESTNLIIKEFITRYGEDLYSFLATNQTAGTFQTPTSVKTHWYPDFLEYSGQNERTYGMRFFSMGLKAASENLLLFPNLSRTLNPRISEYYFKP